MSAAPPIATGNSGAAQSGAPAVAFPKPDRPVADIVSPIWHDEKERDDADEPSQLVRLLGIKSGITVADIGAGSGYYVVRLSPIVGSKPVRDIDTADVTKILDALWRDKPETANRLRGRIEGAEKP